MTERAKKLLLLYYKQSRKIRRVSGLPPLTFKAKKAGTLKNYRIYGNTVNGESVGNRTANLFDGEFQKGYWAYADGLYNYTNTWIATKKIKCEADKYYSFCFNTLSRWYGFIWYDINNNYISTNNLQNDSDVHYRSYSATSPANAAYMAVSIAGYPNVGSTIYPADVTDFMLVEGSTPLPYEPYGYKVPVTVEGKNLLQNTATSQTINGVTFTVNNDGSITCNGTATASAPSVLYIPFTLPIKLYELSGCPDSGSNSTYRVDIRNIDYSMYKYNGNPVVDDGTGCLFDGGNNQYCIRIAPGYTCNNLTFYPMIRLATIEDDTYEPYRTPVTTPIYLPEQIKKVGDEAEYVDYKEQKQHRVRKNLLQNFAASKTISGVTFTVNADGSVTCNGTNTATIATTFNISTYLLIGTYIINGCPKNGSLGTYSVDLRDLFSWYVLGERDTGLGFTFTNNTVRNVYYVIHINPGYTCDNLTFYPMIRKADIEDDTYEPYIAHTELDVTLPTLPTLSGTNTLTVGTEVQPSSVEIKGRIKAAGGD